MQKLNFHSGYVFFAQRSGSRMRCKSLLIFLVVFVQVSVFNLINSVDAWNNRVMYNSLWKLNELASSCTDKLESEDCYLRKIERLEMMPTFKNFFQSTHYTPKRSDIVRKGSQVTTSRFNLYSNDAKFKSSVERLIISPPLQNIYDLIVKPLMASLKKDVDAFKKTVAKTGFRPFYVLPLKRVCASLPAIDLPTLGVEDVCPTVSECSRSFHSSTANACQENNSCDVKKAIPLMDGLFSYKVSFAFVDKLCNCGSCYRKDEYASIVEQMNLLKAFITMIPEKPFDAFFRDAIKVTKQPYSKLGPIMQVISEKDDQFSVANVACNELRAEPACRVMSFYPNYLVLKNMKKERLHLFPKETRDLTLHKNVDHAKLIGRKANLETTKVKGMASYFRRIASFDQRIAHADVTFIRDSLTTFDTRYATLSQKVIDNVNKAMLATTAFIKEQLIVDTTALVARVVADASPIQAVFTDVDLTVMQKQTNALMKDAGDLIKTHKISLFTSLKGLATDTGEIANDLHDFQNQITSLKALVHKIRHKVISRADAEEFIKQYGEYTPKVDRSRFSQNTAKWGAFLMESACKLLTGVERVGESVGKGVENGFLLCEQLEGTIAEFNSLREQMFEFQFDLVECLARIVRSYYVARKLIYFIRKQKQGRIRADQLLGGFLMAQAFLQSQAWLYCDKLEYKNEGRTVQPCSPETGFFTNDELDNLVAFSDHKTYVSVERTVYIPSKPQYSGDLGYINIQALAKKKTASFRLPLDPAWLYKLQWSLLGESRAPYVESFALFLPKKEYKTGSEKVETPTRLIVSVDKGTGSYISTDQQSAVLYKLPESQTSYFTTYKEGYRSSTCSTQIPNPYSLCNNLPKICHTSTNEPGDSLLPTTLSRWRVRYTAQSGEEEVDWLAPNSKTDLRFIAKVKLRMPHRTNPRSGSRGQTDRCCQGNTYRSSLVSNDCEACPSESTSRLGGYYCEADPPAPSPFPAPAPSEEKNQASSKLPTVGRASTKGPEAGQRKSEVASHRHHSNN